MNYSAIFSIVFRWKLLLLFVVIFLAADHPYHVSFMEMELNNNEKIVEVSLKVFSDDLQQAVNRTSKHRVKLGGELSDVDELAVKQYIEKHVVPSVNGKPVDLQFLGVESFPDNMWIYFYFNAPDSTFTLRNSLLFDLYDDQENRVNFTAGTAVKHYRFVKGQESVLITMP